MFKDRLLYVDQRSKKAIKKKHAALKKYIYCNTDKKFCKKYKIVRNHETSTLRSAKYNYEKDLELNINSRNKLFWNFVRKNYKTTTTTTTTTTTVY